ncbi:hypothetical protein C8Q79DRAFT_1000547 [Trametes meyenii]|nr:hypothetical protein C8Q79DRAFT_1000547 [Trametes meyenii]
MQPFRKALPRTLSNALAQRSSPKARKLVLSLIQQQENPLTIQELYHLVQQRLTQNAASEPVIPSMRYLKRVVMEDLKNGDKVEKIYTKQVLTEEELSKLKANMGKTSKKAHTLPTHVELWRWQLKTATPETPVSEKKAFGEQVGVGADWSHLNKRRERARNEKVRRDVRWLRELETARKEETAAS